MVTLSAGIAGPFRSDASPQEMPCLLALATSTELCALGLQVPGIREPFLAQSPSGASASASVLGLIDGLLQAAAIDRRTLTAIAFDCGPGAFTGVRLGCAVAQGLAFALDRLVVPISSLEALVLDGLAECRPGTQAWAAIDARMGEVYCAPFFVDAAGQLQQQAPARVLPAAAAVAWMDSLATLESSASPDRPGAADELRWALGNAFGRITELAAWAHRKNYRVAVDAWPSASAVLVAAERRWRLQGGVNPAQAEPLYVRNKVALEVSEQRQRS